MKSHRTRQTETKDPQETESVRDRRREELRREIFIGLRQADAGEIAPLDIQSIRARIGKRAKA